MIFKIYNIDNTKAIASVKRELKIKQEENPKCKN